MSQRTTVQVEKKATLPLVSGRLRHAAVRPVPEHSIPSVAQRESSFGHDFSRVPARTAAPTVSQAERSASCPMSPRTCPFGGACHTCPVQVQAKLRVGQPGDKYEREADQVAERVMRMPEPSALKETSLSRQIQGIRVQRACLDCEDELRRQPLDEEEDEEEGVLQAKEVFGHAPQVTPALESQVNGLRGRGQPLSESTREFFDARFGHDFSRVRVHTDAKAAESALAVNSLAYTVGRDVVFGAGQYAPGTSAGRRLIAHELTHVVQQRRNSQVPTTLRVGRADDTFEADAECSVASLSMDYANSPSSTPGPQAGTLQRGPGAVAALAGGAVLAFLAGFGIAFGIDYLSMTRERAERYGRELDTNYPGWRSSLPNCPCTMPRDDTANWVSDSNPNLSKYHPKAIYAYRSTAAATRGSRHGQQCTYDAAGRLITSGPGAGTPDVYSPSSYINIPYHIVYDVKTWDELGWSTYNQYWVPNNENRCPANSGGQQAR